MTRQTISVPDLGGGVKTVVIVEWHVQEGHTVSVDQAIATVEVEKVDTQIPSPVAGVVAEILAEPGSELNVGDAMCVIES